jgi:protein-S-isoprenylcysteine O-methyltransferase Ste14
MKGILILIYSVAMQVAIFGSLLFVPAGTLGWPRAWVFIGSTVLGTAATMLYLRDHQDLINERLKGPIQRGQPLSDRIVLNLFLAAWAGLIAFIPLDLFRFHLMGRPGMLVSVLGLVLYAVGWCAEALALHENAFAAPVVKYQEERRQQVIDSGVYTIVRHPMYAGFIPFIVGMCLWLGSYAAALLAAIPMGVIAIRIVIEEQFLRQELEGYGAYMQRTRYRLIPFVW